MGQHASTESTNHSTHPGVITTPRTGSPGDNGVSEDETMVDVSSASSMASRRTRSSSSQQTTVNVSRIQPQRQRPPATSSSPSNGSRPTRRSSLWCRVQSLRNRIYRTTRNINVDRNPPDNPSPVPRSSSSNPLSRRHTLRNSLLSNTNRRSGIFGTAPSQAPTRPLSFQPVVPDPFVDNVDPRYEQSEIQRPRTSQGRSEVRRRSIWGQPPQSPPPPATRTISTVPPSPLPSLPSVIDHSTQTNTVGHPIQPFNITRRPGEDQAEMLSRFLYVAGAALAASLVGSTDSTTAQLQDFSADFADSRDEPVDAPEGSFEGFLRALRQGRSQFAHALRNDTENTPGEESGSAFTYLLMYRFHSRNTTSTTTTTTTTTTTPPIVEENESAMAVERPGTPIPERPGTPIPMNYRPSSIDSNVRRTSSTEPRMVPFVIIGVQPVPPRDSGHTGVPSFSEGVASLLANARQNADSTRPPIVRPTSSGNIINDSLAEQSSSTIPGSWRDSPPPSDTPRRRASVDGSFRASATSPTRERERETNTRAWQMYIYGGAYPENHLIFTAPTLFTDVPSPSHETNHRRQVQKICYF